MADKTRKTIRRRIWWRDNFITVILSLMITGYFAYDLADKRSNEEQHQAILSKIDEYNKKFAKIDNHLYTISIVLVNDPNTDPLLREVLIDYIKNTTRGGSIQ